MSYGLAIRIFTLIPIGAGIWLVPQHWAGLLILYLSAEIIGNDRLIQEDRKLLVIAIGTIAIHGCVAVVDALWWPLPIAQPDPDTFFRAASQIADSGDFRLGIDYVFFENVLALFQVVGGNSRLLGNALSVFWYACSCVVLMRLIRVLAVDQYRYGLVIAFGLLPTALLLRAMTLRESWLLLLLMMVIYGAWQLVREAGGWKGFMMLAVALSGLALLHKVFIVYMVALIPMLCVFIAGEVGIKPRSRHRLLQGAMIAGIALGIGYAVATTDSGRLVTQIFDNEIIEKIGSYRQDLDRLGTPRTAFNIPFDTSSLLATVKTASRIYAHYLFAAPLRIPNNAKDIYALTEGLLRIVFLIAAVAAVMGRSARSPRRYGILLLAIYVSLTCVWAVGTTNYGQAIRHHLLTNWIILLLGYPAVANFCRRAGYAVGLRRNRVGGA